MNFAAWGSIEAWAGRNWPVLAAFGHVLAFTILFGGVALAAYVSGFADGAASALLGAVAIFLIRLYARSIIPAAHRLIDRLHPEPAAPPLRDTFPMWASVVYTLAGLALIATVMAQEETYTYASMLLFAAWAAGHRVLDYLWTRQTKPGTAKARDIIDDWLDDFATRHRTLLARLGTPLGFVLLSGGIALHARGSDFDYWAAALCGIAAIAFVKLYAVLAGTVQRRLIDPIRHVRPEPAPRKPARWAVVLHVVIGLVVFSVMAITRDDSTKTSMSLDFYAMLEFVLGWWIGGRTVLAFF